MGCKEFEQNIYLYEELSTSERELLDAHLATCASCAVAFDEINEAQRVIKKLATDEIVPPNAARLTSDVMSKIANERSDGNSIFTVPFWARARVALTAVSVVLLVSFAVEFLRDSAQLRNIQALTADHWVVLNSKIFRDNFSQGKVRHSLFADCGGRFGVSQGYLECVRGKLK